MSEVGARVKQTSTEKCVIKLQWPIIYAGRDPHGEVLIYNEDRSIYATCSTVAFQGEIRRWLELALKGYVEGRINEEGQLVIERCLAPEEEPIW